MKSNRKIFTMLLCLFMFAMIPMAASAAYNSNTATGQGNLVTAGTVANLHGGQLILTEVTTGKVVFKQYYSAPLGGRVVVESVNGVIPSLPYGTYQLTWTDSIGANLSIHF
ncbi:MULTISPECIES: hypothetical protein [Paenibacillus]|uniref:hypothetical protein n=1 Tax=Paenibacillus TaxID=44249 RepID=UPI0022B9318A|nr:hypothetical protein [Paenibacillus caseinilyticus]MCZ8521610.1 hypothetical protein [Paenibacillus caseinilyticus]